MQSKIHVNQFHSGTALGDAITNEMLTWQTHLRGLGFPSAIFAQHIPDELSSRILDIQTYRPEPGSVLLLHHSMGHDILDAVLDHDHRVVPVYHNITPVEFIDNAYLRGYAHKGHDMLRTLSLHAVAAIADSNFNRKEMLRAGFSSARVIPVRTDFSASVARVTETTRSNDWLFVGRVFQSKGQLELVDAFATSLSHHDDGANLVLVGDTSHTGYLGEIERQARRRGISHRVRILGKVSDEQLAREYASARLFVSMSRHEGFGVPLLEAMAAGLPVVAYATAAIPDTMGGAGITVQFADTQQFVTACLSLASDSAHFESVVEGQRCRIRRLEAFDVGGALQEIIAEAQGPKRPLQVQIQGPFETSYSLAVLNRELATALAARKEFDVSIFATEGPGDYEPKADDLASHPEATLLYRKSSHTPNPDVVIRQMYPPRVHDSPGGLTFQYFGWEESRLPREYVADFNKHLDGIGAMSTFVKDMLEDSGVVVPIDVVGVGVRHPDLHNAADVPELSGARTFRFLHVSSAFPRKGVDLLLDAYFARFSDKDDVSLVLKTFPNPHNEVGALLESRSVGRSDPPHVIWIDRDMVTAEIDGLYRAASALVHPARGEGFGLPVAEAMSARLPVIAPASTGLADFVSSLTAAVVPHSTAPAETHLTVPGSLWEEPDVEALGDLMRSHFDEPSSLDIASRVDNAQRLIAEEFSWQAVASRWAQSIRRRQQRTAAPRVAMVSTWNTRCGIAEYTADLVRFASSSWQVELHANKELITIDTRREEAVQRDWISSPDSPVDELIENLERSSAEIVHLQHNFGFMGLPQLAQVVRRLSQTRPVVVTLHRTEDLESADLVVRLRDIAADLALADRVVVHQQDDANRLRSLGLDRVVVIPIGSTDAYDISAIEARQALGLLPNLDVPVIATYGFLLPHKGTLELIRAAAQLRDRGVEVAVLGVCAVHPDPTSVQYLRLCEAEIQRLDLVDSVRLVTDFLKPEVSRLLLATADIIALPYHETSESSSASLRFVLPIGRPVLATDIAIFADARQSLVLVEPPPTADRLADLLADLVKDNDPNSRYAQLVRHLRSRSSLEKSVALHTAMFQDVLESAAPRPSH